MRSKDREYIGLELSKDLLEKVKLEASQKEISISAFIRMVLIDYMNKKDNKRNS